MSASAPTAPQQAGSPSALPPEWADDERMAFLFSAFKLNREVNCTDWDGKMNFWAPLIVSCCRRRGAVSVTLQELSESFRRNGTVPLGLPTVVQDMIRRGKLQKESEFAALVDPGWLSWGVGLLLVKPLKWTLTTVLGSNRVPPEEPYVVTELVKEKASELLRVYRSSPAAERTLLPFQELRGLAAHICPDETTLCLALLQLQREKQVTVAVHEGEKIVKFTQAGQSRVSPVGEVDLGIYQLQRSERLLGERVEALAQEAERCREEARTLLGQGKKTQALRCLRARKRVEKRADSLHAQLETVQGILERIANSHTDRLVVQAYQAGVSALRLSLKDVTVERAENLVDQIQELCDAQDEVNQTLAGLDISMGGDTDELEAELRSILEDATPDSPPPLPEVPTKPLPSNLAASPGLKPSSSTLKSTPALEAAQ
ncbi:charged multivesicular body protein 7 isoform X1 [Acipenser ruthenus]|uniref:charged multivesicular body protein 7 isoform X1 n=1 Tax=Acipenser ruthenus TaxID=7906 RepID=UPI0027406FE9|nr:charged multivesicular body protein 7 isoform X1 [Acipenser ruthenus]XP_058869658.1 charged multivesicular body protein 7 isoform X1 [Acipenser ruthenus]